MRVIFPMGSGSVMGRMIPSSCRCTQIVPHACNFSHGIRVGARGPDNPRRRKDFAPLTNTYPHMPSPVEDCQGGPLCDALLTVCGSGRTPEFGDESVAGSPLPTSWCRLVPLGGAASRIGLIRCSGWLWLGQGIAMLFSHVRV
ncbi:hypothetical protein AVEN_55011-1 [Araneus ventricosus]|uniref:Uncharacterized protein n=1 Tax=Araneus ventricosus TaxID=182803 RepID=A0A4Y2KVL4_ARAVE|nr:hypothetical protein AVEN_55011-1 [Araneus ventricosus]